MLRRPVVATNVEFFSHYRYLDVFSAVAVERALGGAAGEHFFDLVGCWVWRRHGCFGENVLWQLLQFSADEQRLYGSKMKIVCERESVCVGGKGLIYTSVGDPMLLFHFFLIFMPGHDISHLQLQIGV